MSNWYVIAKNVFLSCKWIDPSGKIHDAFMHHESWIDNNKDFLRENYNIDIPDSITVEPFELLIDQGWIRMLQDYDDLVFTIKSFSPEILGIIENFIFFNYSNREIRKVWIADKNKLIHFKWQDFIEEGASFIDFVEDLIRLY